MSLRTFAGKFVELCRQGKHGDVMRTMYSPDIVSVEGDGTQANNQQEVLKRSSDFWAVHEAHGGTVRGPFFGGPTGGDGKFSVSFTFDLTDKPSGKRFTLEEVAVYTVKNDLVTREEFYFDAGQ